MCLSEMDVEEIAFARKTYADYGCLVCGYTGPLAYGAAGVPVCQACQSGAGLYLVPHCPQCHSPVYERGGEIAGRRFTCRECGMSWEEPRCA